MSDIYRTNLVAAAELRLALSQHFPDLTYGAVPVTDYRDAIEAFRAYDDGGLAEVPNAFAAYLRNERNRQC